MNAGCASAVVDECPDDRGVSRVGRRSAPGDRRGDRVAELVEVADEGEREELLLAGEVAVDDRPVDADGLGDVLDLRVPHPALVEQRAGGRDDLLLTGARRAAAAERRPSVSGARVAMRRC